MLTNAHANTVGDPFDHDAADADRVIMVREARLSTPPGFLVPGFAEGFAGAFTGEREVRHRDTTYFDTASLRLADLGITVRRDHGASGYDWTLVLTTDPGAPFPVRRRMRYEHRTPGVPRDLARYLRNHHRPVGIRPQASVSGRADVLPFEMRGVHVRVGEIVDEILVTRSISERIRILRQITVVSFDLDGVGHRLLEAATSRLLDAGCSLEFVTGDLYRFIEPLPISEADAVEPLAGARAHQGTARDAGTRAQRRALAVRDRR